MGKLPWFQAHDGGVSARLFEEKNRALAVSKDGHPGHMQHGVADLSPNCRNHDGLWRVPLQVLLNLDGVSGHDELVIVRPKRTRIDDVTNDNQPGFGDEIVEVQPSNRGGVERAEKSE